MIVKKPYAFLIRNFRVIHAVLFLTMTYICYKIFNIFNFFNDYISFHYYEKNISLSSKYIGLFIFILLLISSLVNLIIYFILTIKKKNNKVYLFNFIMEIVIFIYFIYIHTVLKGLEVKSLEATTVMAHRDIALIVLIPELALTLIMLARTFGFNLKQFDFRKDYEGIEIIQSDNEEIELTFGDNTYKIKRFFRKLLRLTKYFVVENKVLVIGLSSVLTLILSITIFMKINVYNKEYEEKQKIMANALSYLVNTSYITKYGIDNSIINEDKEYIIVDINIDNNSGFIHEITRETFKLVVSDSEIIPNFGYKKEFQDLGTLFEPMKIENNSSNKYIIVFEIDEDLKNEKFVLKIKNFDNNTLIDLDSRYKNIRIKPKDIDILENKTNYNLIADIDLKDSILNDTKIKINEYEISDIFKDKASIILNNTYKDVYYVVSPNNISNSGGKSVLRIKNTLESSGNKVIKSASFLIDNYGIIKYKINNKEKSFNVEVIDTKYNNDIYTYIEVPNDIKKAQNIELLLVIRGLKYTINLK